MTVPARYRVYAFYRFFAFTDFLHWKAPIQAFLNENSLKGTVLLAPEGINATVSGEESALDGLMRLLSRHPGMRELPVKRHTHASQPFKRAKVKLKKEIIAFGQSVDASRYVSKALDAQSWNRLIAEPGVTLLDARNAYEVEKGAFSEAIDPKTRSFKEIIPFIDQHLMPEANPRIATYCTGGIRCEKLAAFLHAKGFKEVYQLKGGILQYLENILPEENRFEGECFVFDERETVSI